MVHKKKAAPPKNKKVGKTSNAKLKNARNECCPVLGIDCVMVTPKAVRKKHVIHTGMGKPIVTWREEVGPAVKKCSVKVGARKVLSNADPDDAGRKLAKLKKALIDKRCCAVVKSGDKAPVTTCPR